MADTNNIVVESEWIRKIRSGLQAGSGQNAGGDVPIKKLPASLRIPVERYTPRQWHFGLHNRDPQASISESEVLKISLAAACKLNPVEWDKFCADVVDNPADMMLKSYGVTELSTKEVQYLLTLDALTLVLVLSSLSRMRKSSDWLPNLFIESLVAGGFNIEALVKNDVAYCTIWDDLFLCENQIPMALMKKAISKCYGLLPEERKYNHLPKLRELEIPDSYVTKELLDTILKIVAYLTCSKFFAEPWPIKFWNLINVKYEVGKLENCAHVFACIHKVMTSCVESITADKKSHATDTKVSAPAVNQQLERDEEALATVGMPPSSDATAVFASQPSSDATAVFAAVATTFGGAKQLFLLATIWKQLASVIATIFGFSRETTSRETATEAGFGLESLKSATDLKKAGLQIKGIPGMVQQVAFENRCLFLPIMSQTEKLESYICNMAAYETWNTQPPFRFMDYLLLMSHLIKTPEDVSFLVDCGVIRAYLGTQQRTFQMWERLQSAVRFPAYSDEYRENIVNPINRHCASPRNVMVTEFYNRFCSRWWLVIGVISAIIFFVATLIQTYVLVIGSDKMQPHFPRGG